MDFKIVWTKRALQEYSKIIFYLKEVWTNREVVNFDNRVEQIISGIQIMPQRHRPSVLDKNLRRATITEKVSMIYLIKPRKKEIVILSIWDNRRNPKKLKF